MLCVFLLVEKVTASGSATVSVFGGVDGEDTRLSSGGLNDTWGGSASGSAVLVGRALFLTRISTSAEVRTTGGRFGTGLAVC